MTAMMAHPQCFTQHTYDDWLEWRQRSMEAVSVCDDCTKEYETRMKADGRCKPVQAKQVIVYRMVRNAKM